MNRQKAAHSLREVPWEWGNQQQPVLSSHSHWSSPTGEGKGGRFSPPPSFPSPFTGTLVNIISIYVKSMWLLWFGSNCTIICSQILSNFWIWYLHLPRPPPMDDGREVIHHLLALHTECIAHFAFISFCPDTNDFGTADVDLTLIKMALLAPSYRIAKSMECPSMLCLLSSWSKNCKWGH